MAIKKLFRKARSIAGAPGRAITKPYFDSKVRTNQKYNDQITDDIKSVREMKQSGVGGGSLQDPNSRARREMRIDGFKDKMEKEYGTPGKGKRAKPKRLFRRKPSKS